MCAWLPTVWWSWDKGAPAFPLEGKDLRSADWMRCSAPLLPSPWRGRIVLFPTQVRNAEGCCLPLGGEGGPKGRMRCRPAGRVPLCWEIILLDSSQQLDLFSARSARAKGSGDPAPVPLILWTPYPRPAPGLRARTRGRHIFVRKSKVNQQVGAPGDAPFFCAAERASPFPT